MKIRFVNNSVSGVNRKYQDFVLDIPGHSSQVIDVPPQYVRDILSYLSYRHPAVICTPIVKANAEAPQSAETDSIAGKAEEPTTTGESVSDVETDAETAGTDNPEEGVVTDSLQGEAEAKEDIVPEAKAGSTVMWTGRGDRKNRKSGGKK